PRRTVSRTSLGGCAGAILCQLHEPKVCNRQIGVTMSTLTLGQEFASPVTQTILPVAEIITGSTRNGNVASARIVGFYPLSPTEFTGLETSVALASGQVATTSVRLPAANGVQPEYLVARFSNHEANQEAWRGHS